MKKKLLIYGTCIALAFSMTACGKSKKSKGNKDTSEYTSADMSGTQYKSTVTLGQYVGLKVGESNASVTDEELQNAIDKILTSKAVDTKYEEGTVTNGDKVNIDYVGKVDGEEFDGGSYQGYDLTIGSNTFITGFEDGLIGKNVKDTVDLNLKFPDDYKDKDGNVANIAGKDVVFTVTINYITRSEKPELTDDFVASQCSEYKSSTVDELKEYVKSQLILNKKLTAIWQTLLDSCEVQYDEDEVATLQEKTKQDFLDYYGYYNVTLNDYLEYAQITEEQYDEQIKEDVESKLKNMVIALTIARENNITVSEEEYNEEVKTDIEQGTYDSTEDFQKDYPKQDTVDSLLYYKALEWIADQCEVVPDSEAPTTTAAVEEAPAATEETTAAE